MSPPDAAHAVIDDLHDECEQLDALLASLPAEMWVRPTPAPGWTIAHQVAHLELTEDLMILAARDEARFRQRPADAPTVPDLDGSDIATAASAEARLTGWRRSRSELAALLRAAPAGTRLPWVGPPMSVASAATARLMEVWAHGQDVHDALGLTRVPTRRLRHIAHLAVATRDFSFRNRGLEPPSEPFRVEVHGPEGEEWAFGPRDATQRVEGDALDLALLATRRIHRADARLRPTGPDADRWLDVIQTFAGPPGAGRAPRAG